MNDTREPCRYDGPDTERLEQIRARAESVPAGPWAWRGNIDHGDPRLVSLATGYDVLGHVRHEVTRDEAARRGVGDPDHIEVGPLYDGKTGEPIGVHVAGRKVLNDPPDTFDERYEAALDDARHDAITEYLTDEYGEPRTEDRLALTVGHWYQPVRDLVVFEVAPDATDREDPRVYRADVVGIRHPVAVFLEHAKADIDHLLAENAALRARLVPGDAARVN